MKKTVTLLLTVLASVTVLLLLTLPTLAATEERSFPQKAAAVADALLERVLPQNGTDASEALLTLGVVLCGAAFAVSNLHGKASDDKDADRKSKHGEIK